MADDEFNADNFAAYRTRKAAQEREAAIAKAIADPETAAILAETRQAQQETVESSRTAAKTIKETMVVADRTTATLKQQGEQLSKVDATAEQADFHADDAYKSARDLHKYKGLLPFSIKNMFTGSKKKTQDSELDKINRRLDKQAVKLEQPNEPSVSPRKASAKPTAALATDDPAEREIDQNLDTISSGLDFLKTQGLEMQREISAQNVTISKIEARTEHTDYTLNSANRKIREFL